MSQSTFLIRILGGRNLTATYDNVAATIVVAGQSLTLSTLSAALQAQFTGAVTNATGGGTDPLALGQGKGAAAFGGDNLSAAIGAIMDLTPTWRTAIMNAIVTARDAAGVPTAFVKDDTSSAQW